MKGMIIMRKISKLFSVLLTIVIVCSFFTVCAFAEGAGGGGGGGGGGNVATAVENTWKSASGQIKTVVNNVVFPIIDVVLAVFFFAKLGLAYFDYRKSGLFEWAGPAVLFACLVFTLTAPTYIWSIVSL